MLFDSSALDFEMFGRETPSHFELISITSGLIAMPFFVLMNFLSGDDIKSFMGILQSRYDPTFSFYEDFFGSQWQPILIMVIVSILYTIKPITSTNFILSISSTDTYIITELLSKTIFVLATTIFIENKAKLGSIDAIAFSFSLLSQYLYCYYSNSFKDEIEVDSICESIKNLFTYDSI